MEIVVGVSVVVAALVGTAAVLLVRANRKPEPKPPEKFYWPEDVQEQLAKKKAKPRVKKAAPKIDRKKAHRKKGNSRPDRAFDILAKQPERNFTALEIAQELGIGMQSSWNALSKLVVDGLAVRVDKGVYRYAGKAVAK